MDVRLFRGKNVDLTTTRLKELRVYLSWIKVGIRSGIRRTWIERTELKLDTQHMKTMNLQEVNKEININYNENTKLWLYSKYGKNASYKVVGNQSGKVKRNG